jgi:hypothetical protein
MARCVLTVDGFARVVELLPSTLLGRARRCDVVVPGEGIPAYWLEIRWMGEAWAWRELTPLETLRPAGEPRSNGWRSLRVAGAGGRGTRLRWGASGDSSLEVVDDSAPTSMVIDLSTRAPRAETLRFVEERADGTFLLDEDSQPLRRLQSDEVFVAEGRAWQFILPASLEHTVRMSLSLTHPAATLSVTPTSALVQAGSRSASVDGEFVRALYTYVAARLGDPERGGWLSMRQAWDGWLASGGHAASPPERMGWDRGKVRTAFAAAGVAGTSELFEVARVEGESRCRVALPPERLKVG